MSKIEQDKMELYEEPLDLWELCAEAVRMLSDRARVAGLTMDLKLPAWPALLLADRRAPQQILNNLVGNAIEFTPKGGHVVVAATAATNDSLNYRSPTPGLAGRPIM